jgi:hypothetical protein
MEKLRKLKVLCDIMLVTGGILICLSFIFSQLPSFLLVLSGAGGFAGIIKPFLPLPPPRDEVEWIKRNRNKGKDDDIAADHILCAFVGFIIIVFACLLCNDRL